MTFQRTYDVGHEYLLDGADGELVRVMEKGDGTITLYCYQATIRTFPLELDGNGEECILLPSCDDSEDNWDDDGDCPLPYWVPRSESYDWDTEVIR